MEAVTQGLDPGRYTGAEGVAQWRRERAVEGPTHGNGLDLVRWAERHHAELSEVQRVLLVERFTQEGLYLGKIIAAWVEVIEDLKQLRG